MGLASSVANLLAAAAAAARRVERRMATIDAETGLAVTDRAEPSPEGWSASPAGG